LGQKLPTAIHCPRRCTLTYLTSLCEELRGTTLITNNPNYYAVDGYIGATTAAGIHFGASNPSVIHCTGPLTQQQLQQQQHVPQVPTNAHTQVPQVVVVTPAMAVSNAPFGECTPSGICPGTNSGSCAKKEFLTDDELEDICNLIAEEEEENDDKDDDDGLTSMSASSLASSLSSGCTTPNLVTTLTDDLFC
jgi:hypothetical protein